MIAYLCLGQQDGVDCLGITLLGRENVSTLTTHANDDIRFGRSIGLVEHADRMSGPINHGAHEFGHGCVYL